MKYQLSQAGFALTKIDESFSSHVYLDEAGIPTIGFGFRVLNGKPVTMDTPPMTLSQAQYELRNQMQKYVDAVNSLVKVNLTQNQFDALVSTCYNVGEVQFANTRLLKAVNASDFKLAAAVYPSTDIYDKKNGVETKSQGLINRRMKELNMFLNGTV